MGICAGVGVLGFFIYARQRGKGVETAAGLLAHGELEAAEREVARLEAKRPRIQQWLLDSLMGGILWLKGDLRGGIERLERAQLSAKGVQQRFNKFTLAMLYAIVGRTQDAEVLRRTLTDLPDSDALRLMRARLELCMAFHSHKIDGLAAEEELHDIGKLALTTNKFGDLLVLLSWACFERGDRDLSSHWLNEGLPRLKYDLSVYMPDVHKWVESRT